MTSFADAIFTRLTGGSDDDGGLDEHALDHEAGSFTRHVGALSSTKLADGLLDPKLVLSWLVNGLGASSVLTGLLVPIREAGSLLPQLVIAPRIHALATARTPGLLVRCCRALPAPASRRPGCCWRATLPASPSAHC